jgi:hypothetical protein
MSAKNTSQAARLAWPILVLMLGFSLLAGCYHTPIGPNPESPAPLRLPPPGPDTDGHCNYEDSLTGAQVFTMYCGYCHFARSLAERPFSNYKTAAAHMRVVADLTGKEHAKLMEYLRRFHDIPPPGHEESPAPTRFFFSQPISELRDQQPKNGTDLPGGPRPGATSEGSPGQPAPGVSPQEAR